MDACLLPDGVKQITQAKLRRSSCTITYIVSEVNGRNKRSHGKVQSPNELLF